jgi:hypothetical protein
LRLLHLLLQLRLFDRLCLVGQLRLLHLLLLYHLLRPLRPFDQLYLVDQLRLLRPLLPWFQLHQ